MKLFSLVLLFCIVILCIVESSLAEFGNSTTATNGQIRRRRVIRRRDCGNVSKLNVQADNQANEFKLDAPTSSNTQPTDSSTSDSSPTNINGGQEFTGNLTYYDVGGDACGTSSTNEDMVAALNAPQYKADKDGMSTYCGVCATILGDKAQVVVKIVDECPECPYGSLDLSPAAFKATTNADGEAFKIRWYFTKC